MMCLVKLTLMSIGLLLSLSIYAAVEMEAAVFAKWHDNPTMREPELQSQSLGVILGVGGQIRQPLEIDVSYRYRTRSESSTRSISMVKPASDSSLGINIDEHKLSTRLSWEILESSLILSARLVTLLSQQRATHAEDSSWEYGSKQLTIGRTEGFYPAISYRWSSDALTSLYFIHEKVLLALEPLKSRRSLVDFERGYFSFGLNHRIKWQGNVWRYRYHHLDVIHNDYWRDFGEDLHSLGWTRSVGSWLLNLDFYQREHRLWHPDLGLSCLTAGADGCGRRYQEKGLWLMAQRVLGDYKFITAYYNDSINVMHGFSRGRQRHRSFLVAFEFASTAAPFLGGDGLASQSDPIIDGFL